VRTVREIDGSEEAVSNSTAPTTPPTTGTRNYAPSIGNNYNNFISPRNSAQNAYNDSANMMNNSRPSQSNQPVD